MAHYHTLPIYLMVKYYVHMYTSDLFLIILQIQAIPTNMIDSTCNSCFLWM